VKPALGTGEIETTNLGPFLLPISEKSVVYTFTGVCFLLLLTVVGSLITPTQVAKDVAIN
jgi:hypothetical protein